MSNVFEQLRVIVISNIERFNLVILFVLTFGAPAAGLYFWTTVSDSVAQALGAGGLAVTFLWSCLPETQTGFLKNGLWKCIGNTLALRVLIVVAMLCFGLMMSVATVRVEHLDDAGQVQMGPPAAFETQTQASDSDKPATYDPADAGERVVSWWWHCPLGRRQLTVVVENYGRKTVAIGPFSRVILDEDSFGPLVVATPTPTLTADIANNPKVVRVTVTRDDEEIASSEIKDYDGRLIWVGVREERSVPEWLRKKWNSRNDAEGTHWSALAGKNAVAPSGAPVELKAGDMEET